MNYFVWIFLGLYLASIILYIISAIKNIKIPLLISKVALLPFLTGLTVSLLIERYPDSLHTILISGFAMLLIILSEVFFIFKKNPKFYTAAKTLFILNPFVWFELHRTIFNIYKTPLAVHIIGILLGIAIFIIIFLFSGKQNLKIYAFLAFGCSGIVLLTYTALITMYSTLKLYSFILMLGVLTLAASYGLQVIQYKKPQLSNLRRTAVFRIVLINSAQLLICAAAVLMIF